MPALALDVQSTSKGLLIPSCLTQAQRTVISNPANGLQVFQTDGSSGVYFNAGTPASPNWTTSWNTTGNIEPIRLPTFWDTDNNPLNFRINNLYAGQLNPVNGSVFLGLRAGQNNNTAYSNIAIGNGALYYSFNRNNLVAVGIQLTQ